MNPARRDFHAFIYLFLALPGFVSAQEPAAPMSEGASADNVPLQLAAAIGIIKSEPSAPPQVEEPIEPPAQPENQVSPPVPEQAEPAEAPLASNDEEAEESEPAGISRSKIWIGVGVAALLGVVAGGGGGGGGSSSTPQH
jgi:hypothetical protein